MAHRHVSYRRRDGSGLVGMVLLILTASALAAFGSDVGKRLQTFALTGGVGFLALTMVGTWKCYGALLEVKDQLRDRSANRRSGSSR